MRTGLSSVSVASRHRRRADAAALVAILVLTAACQREGSAPAPAGRAPRRGHVLRAGRGQGEDGDERRGVSAPTVP